MDLELRTELISKDHNIQFSELDQEVMFSLDVILASSFFFLNPAS